MLLLVIRGCNEIAFLWTCEIKGLISSVMLASYQSITDFYMCSNKSTHDLCCFSSLTPKELKKLWDKNLTRTYEKTKVIKNVALYHNSQVENTTEALGPKINKLYTLVPGL